MNLKNYLPELGIAKRLTGRKDSFNSFKREMTTLIDKAFAGYSFPEIGHGDLNIDVCDKGKELEVKIELPGVSEEDVKISIQDNNLIITGEKKEESKEEKKNFYVMERVYGSFMRSIPLPFKVNSDKVSAELEQGILTILIQKPKEVQSTAKTIKIKKKRK